MIYPVRSLPDNFEPGPSDVVVAKGKKWYNHAGNKMLRGIAASKLEEYESARTKMDKSCLISNVVDSIRENGHFVKLDKNGCWLHAEDLLCREKTSAVFREALQSSRRSSFSSLSSKGGVAAAAVAAAAASTKRQRDDKKALTSQQQQQQQQQSYFVTGAEQLQMPPLNPPSFNSMPPLNIPSLGSMPQLTSMPSSLDNMPPLKMPATLKTAGPATAMFEGSNLQLSAPTLFQGLELLQQQQTNTSSNNDNDDDETLSGLSNAMAAIGKEELGFDLFAWPEL